MTDPTERREMNTSVDQVFDVLHLLSRAGRPVTAVEVTSALQVSASTAHRLLATLEEAGYAERSGGAAGRVLGIRAHELADALFDRFAVRALSLPFLRRLAAASQETAALYVRVGWYAMRIAAAEGLHDIHRTVGIGELASLDAPGGPRALLGGLAEAELRRYVAFRAGHDGDELRSLAATVRERRYALDEPGGEPRSARSLSFPLRGTDGRAVAAISIEGDPSQFDPSPALLERCAALVAAFEAELRERPDVVDPFAHVDPDTIVLGDAL